MIIGITDMEIDSLHKEKLKFFQATSRHEGLKLAGVSM